MHSHEHTFDTPKVTCLALFNFIPPFNKVLNNIQDDSSLKSHMNLQFS